MAAPGKRMMKKEKNEDFYKAILLLENEEEYKALRERVKGYVPKTWDDTAIAIEKQLLSVL